MRIGILGTGNVAGALGARWAAAGHDVALGSRTPEGGVRGDGPVVVGLREAAEHGEVLVNATPGTESLGVLRAVGADALAGKVLIDVGIGFTPDWALSHPVLSLGEEIQQAFPDLAVVKTLCTVTASVMADPAGLSSPGTMFLSGEDDAAKRTVGLLLTDLGWPESAQLDLGGIGTARGQEHFALLFLGVAGALGTHVFNIGVVPAADGPAIGASRTARRSNRYAESVAFYRDVVGLPLLHLTDGGEDGTGVAIFGLPGTSTTFELLPAREPVPVDRHEQLVLYFPGKPARDEVAHRLTASGHEPTSQYRYWDLNDAVTFLDPDGRELVLAPWVFGRTPPPMRTDRHVEAGVRGGERAGPPRPGTAGGVDG